MGRRKKKHTAFVVGESQEFPAMAEQGFETAYVQIGGVRITNHGLSRSHGARGKSPHQKPWRSLSQHQPRLRAPRRADADSDGDDDGDGGDGCSSDVLEEDLQDYLENVLGAADIGSSKRSGAGRHPPWSLGFPVGGPRDFEESSAAEFRVPVGLGRRRALAGIHAGGSDGDDGDEDGGAEEEEEGEGEGDKV
ncbi:hypothetical protein VOLCADRAFT_100914, partial [Volvox carteri f. nagariensis]